jgi:hypothetical protein
MSPERPIVAGDARRLRRHGLNARSHEHSHARRHDLCAKKIGYVSSFYECSAMKLTLDYDDQMSESDESNNSAEGIIYWKKVS